MWPISGLHSLNRLQSSVRGLCSLITDCEFRMEKFNEPGDEQRRAQRGRKYFDTLWGSPEGGQAHRDRACKYYPDVCMSGMPATNLSVAADLSTDLLNIKTNYELWMSEDAILSDVETQLCNLALLICNNSPQQAGWHLHGCLRHGATKEEAKFSQDLALAVARQFGVNVGNIQKVEDLE